jgi:4-hydroxy-tetrahydrodipicolinate synthase
MAPTGSSRPHGPYAPVITPFAADGTIATGLFVAHCRWLLDKGVGLAVFGTNSEAASVSMAERLAATEALVAAGIDPARLMPGTGLCALPETVQLTRHAVALGAGGVLMLPPYFFKNVSEDGLFAYYSEVIEQVADARLSVYLYHIPQMTQVPITLGLIERLLKRYPRSIAGAKDSSGDWSNTKAMIDNFAAEGFDVFPASESHLLEALAIGGAGCISATANVNPGGIRQLYDRAGASDAGALHAAVGTVRKIFETTSMIPAMKSVLANAHREPLWRKVRPPLVAMDTSSERDLLARLGSAGFNLLEENAAPA